MRIRTRINRIRVTADGRRIQEAVALDGKTRFMSVIRPSAPIRIKYQKRLDTEIDEMVRSINYWLTAAYRQNQPATVALGQDASPSKILQDAFDKLASRWLKRFDKLAPKMAEWFASSTKTRVEASLMADLRKAGFTVRMTMTKAMRDAYNAVVDENIGLIKSIPQQHLNGVRTVLMQSVQLGGDLKLLADDLQKRSGITRRRAAFIALDQNNKATAVLQRTRYLEMGITQAKWLHSAGGKHPRPEHVAFSGQLYDVAKGHDFKNGEGTVWPGTAINCRCVSVPVIPGIG